MFKKTRTFEERDVICFFPFRSCSGAKMRGNGFPSEKHSKIREIEGDKQNFAHFSLELGAIQDVLVLTRKYSELQTQNCHQLRIDLIPKQKISLGTPQHNRKWIF